VLRIIMSAHEVYRPRVFAIGHRRIVQVRLGYLLRRTPTRRPTTDPTSVQNVGLGSSLWPVGQQREPRVRPPRTSVGRLGQFGVIGGGHIRIDPVASGKESVLCLFGCREFGADRGSPVSVW
jgi:hypothetical protein